MKELEITILIEDSVYQRRLIAEHGISFWFKYGGKEYLFDTGQGYALLHNAEELDIDLKNLSGVFLSHGHDDHTGGLNSLLSVNPEIKVYGHPDAFIPKYKYSQKEDKLTEIGMNTKKEDIVNFIPVKKIKEISKGIYLTGEVPRINQFEKIAAKYKVGVNKIEKDSIIDDETLFINTKKGLVVLLGCSHAGVVNIVNYIKKFKEKEKIYAIIGGMHLINADQDRIEKTIKYLSELDFEFMVPLHCTGFNAVNKMKNYFGNKVRIAHAGDKFTF